MKRELLPLPIDELLPEILETLSSHNAAVLQAEPGAGKTTRIAPAILKSGLAQLANKSPGLIVLLQPRRVAARSAAARIAEEQSFTLGEEVGYQVRFEKRSSKNTRILVCTEGVFLRRMQDDPLLHDISVIIFDEFHERSLDSDLALALAKQVQSELAPDLRIIAMSATMDTDPVSAYLGSCPVIKVPGRTYPVAREYISLDKVNEPLERLASQGAREMLARVSGDILVFLPGLAEIRQSQYLLEDLALKEKNLELMTLYGDMPLEEQQLVLQKSKKRKIILATNVAETSITIDGVEAVVDTGMARKNILDSRLGLNRLELCRISKASAEQRSGRAGRTAPGVCLRLWPEKQQALLPDAELPEIARVELSQCLLQLYFWGEQNPRAFPWFEAPPEQALEQALLVLERLGALAGGKLTALGKQMASLPIQPRLARLIIEGIRLGDPERACLCAALLSERDPFIRARRTFDRDDLVVGVSRVAEHHSDSDLIDKIEALEDFAAGRQIRYAGVKLISAASKNVLRVKEQLLRISQDSGLTKQDGRLMKPVNSQLSTGDSMMMSPVAAKTREKQPGDEAILKALLAAFPDRVCRRREDKGRRALMVGGRGVKLADESALSSGEFFLALEISESGKSESLVKQASLIEKSWLEESGLQSHIDAYYDPKREKIIATCRLCYFDLCLEENIVPLPRDLDCAKVLVEAIKEHYKLEDLFDEDLKQYLARLRFLAKFMPELKIAELDEEKWQEILLEWACSATSMQELKEKALLPLIQNRLSREQIAAVEKEAPSHMAVPSGSRIKIDYLSSDTPVLAVRIQEIFGLKETPRLAASRAALLMHLLAPNYRPQQITSDLASFWKNSYGEVRKDLRSRYPKHSWPEDPLSAVAERRPQRKQT